MPDNICSLCSHHLLRVILASLDRDLNALPRGTGIANTTLLKHSRHERLHLLLQRFIRNLHLQQVREFSVRTLETVQKLIPYKYGGDLTVRNVRGTVSLWHNARL